MLLLDYLFVLSFDLCLEAGYHLSLICFAFLMLLFALLKFSDLLLTIFEVSGQVIDLVLKLLILFNLLLILIRLVEQVDPLFI